MRGKVLAATYRLAPVPGRGREHTRQEYLDDEWDGISEPAAYREISEWPLA
ncbi:hypothetical protein [Streptomyces goshikiensis]